VFLFTEYRLPEKEGGFSNGGQGDFGRSFSMDIERLRRNWKYRLLPIDSSQELFHEQVMMEAYEKFFSGIFSDDFEFRRFDKF
jgi:hypothetical protein